MCLMYSVLASRERARSLLQIAQTYSIIKINQEDAGAQHFSVVNSHVTCTVLGLGHSTNSVCLAFPCLPGGST